MSNRHQRRANIAAFRRDASHGLTTYLIGDDEDAMLDRAPLLLEAIAFWRANAATRKPICIGCKGQFTGEARVEVAAFLLATSPASSGSASVSGICVTCWSGLSDDELERAALRVLRAFLPNAKFEDAS